MQQHDYIRMVRERAVEILRSKNNPFLNSAYIMARYADAKWWRDLGMISEEEEYFEDLLAQIRLVKCEGAGK